MNLKEWTISYIDSLRESQITETLKITRQSKDYATGPDFTVYKVDGLPQFSINVNSSAGWSTDPHDKRGRELRLMDSGNRRATLYWKEGNLKALAKQMHDLTSETTWGEGRGLTPDDYYKVLKMWVDMGLHESVNESTNKTNLVEKLNTLLEKNVPTNPSKWSYYKSQAKKKFDVYPSAYANAWAAKKYKAAGGGWKKESVNEWTDRNFYMSQSDMNLSLLKKIMPSVVGSAKSAEQRLKQFVGGQMWVHGQHHNIIGKDGKKYEIGQNQYYLGKGTNVNATSATFKKILPDGDTEVIGTLYVDTDDLLKAIKKQGIKESAKKYKAAGGKWRKKESVNEAKNTIGLAFKDEDDYNGFVEFIKDEGGKISKNIGWDSKTKSWEVIMDVKVLDDIYGKVQSGNKESGWYGALPGDFESVIIESVNEAKFKYDPKIDYFDEYELLPQEVQDALDAHDFDDDSYSAAKKTIKQLNKVGWTADYELSGDMTDLKPLGESVNEVSWAEMEKIDIIQKQIKKHIQDNYEDSIDYKKDRWMKGYSDLVGHFGKSLNKKNLKNIAKLAKQKNDKKLMKLLSDLLNI